MTCRGGDSGNRRKTWEKKHFRRCAVRSSRISWRGRTLSSKELKRKLTGSATCSTVSSAPSRAARSRMNGAASTHCREKSTGNRMRRISGILLCTPFRISKSNLTARFKLLGIREMAAAEVAKTRKKPLNRATGWFHGIPLVSVTAFAGVEERLEFLLGDLLSRDQLAAYRAEPITTVCGLPGMGTAAMRSKPASRYMASSSRNVYASPDSVVVSIVRLKLAGMGGETRSSLGTNSSVAARPPGFSAA